jgi:hypothetical protein
VFNAAVIDTYEEDTCKVVGARCLDTAQAQWTDVFYKGFIYYFCLNNEDAATDPLPKGDYCMDASC